jgi:hypothetical protein
MISGRDLMTLPNSPQEPTLATLRATQRPNRWADVKLNATTEDRS